LSRSLMVAVVLLLIFGGWGVMEMLGMVMLLASLLLCVITLIPYRKGEKWAWYALLVIGGFLFGEYAPSTSKRQFSASIFLFIS